MKMTATVLSTIGVLLVCTPRISDAEQTPSRDVEPSVRLCASKLESIFRLIRMREHHSGGAAPFPRDLRTLYLMVGKPYYFVCPSDKELEPVKGNDREDFRTSYAIVDNIEALMAKKVDPSLMAIIFEKSGFHNGGRHVLFYDGTIELMNDRQFKELKKAGFIRVIGQVGPKGSKTRR
jgi:hypothetical protein